MPEHRMVVQYIGDGITSVEYFLDHYLSWHQRIIPAVKFLLGTKAKESHFDTTILDACSVKNFRDALTKILEVIQRELVE